MLVISYQLVVILCNDVFEAIGEVKIQSFQNVGEMLKGKRVERIVRGRNGSKRLKSERGERGERGESGSIKI